MLIDPADLKPLNPGCLKGLRLGGLAEAGSRPASLPEGQVRVGFALWPAR